MSGPDKPLGALTPLAAFRQFIPVMLVPLPNGKTDKIPVSAAGYGIDAHTPANWMTHQDAQAAADRLAQASGMRHGIGFVLTVNDPFWCLDIDDCAVPGGWSPTALMVCGMLPGTVVEISQSGMGLHIWGSRLQMPAHSKKNTELGLELYSDLRFMVLGSGAVGEMSPDCVQIDGVVASVFPPRDHTGLVHGDGPRPDWRGPADDGELLRRALQATSAKAAFQGKATFADLYHCNVEALARTYPSSGDSPYDASGADAALAQHLAFWTGCDSERIGRLMRMSKLERGKWEREDYLPRTIANACSMQREVLQDKPVIQAPEGQVGPVVRGETVTVPMASPVAVKTFLGAQEQIELFAGCVYVVDAHKVLMPNGSMINPERFRVKFGGRTFVMDDRNERTTRNAFEAFTESQLLDHPRVDSTCFRPDLPPAAIMTSATGYKRVNTWRPISNEESDEDPSPIVDHIRRLLPNGRDAEILISFMAFCVQYLGRKAAWAVLIQGVEGNGKSLLTRVMNYCLGTEYVYPLKASKIANQFNGYLVGKLLVSVEDVVPGKGGIDFMEHLKDLIAGGPTIEIERKGIDQTSAEICCNFLMNSNHRDALKLSRNGRRICWLACAQQEKADKVRDGLTPKYFSDLHEWLETGGGYAATLGYLKRYPIPDDLNPAKGATEAPETTTSAQAVADNVPPGAQAILDAIDECLPGFKGGWVSTIAVKRVLEGRRLSVDFPKHQWRGLLESQGYVTHPALGAKGQTDNLVMPDNGKPVLYVKRDHPDHAITQRAGVAQAYTKAQQP